MRVQTANVKEPLNSLESHLVSHRNSCGKISPHCRSAICFSLQEWQLVEMALVQLNFHLKLVLASTSTCSLTLHYPCSVTWQSATALAMSRIKIVMVMPLRCENVSPCPWKSLVHCRDTSTREKYVYPKSLEAGKSGLHPRSSHCCLSCQKKSHCGPAHGQFLLLIVVFFSQSHLLKNQK